MQSDEREYPVTQNAKEIKQEISIIELNISFLQKASVSLIRCHLIRGLMFALVV